MGKIYNENAAALTWEILNNVQDIGNFEILYNGKVIKGKGFVEFLKAARTLSPDINVIYTKHLKWFIIVSQNFIDYSDKEFFANGDLEFYWIRMIDNVELRNWDNFWKKIDDKEEFLRRLEICRNYFRKDNEYELKKNKLGLKNNYKYSLARDQYNDIYRRHYLYNNEINSYCWEMVPKTEEELDLLDWLSKASFYYSNSNYFNKSAYKVHCYDISSSHLGFFARKTFPMEGFKLEIDTEKIQKIISDRFECWYACIEFDKLQYKIDFPVDLSKFGEAALDRGQCCYNLVLTNVDMEWFKEVFSWKAARVNSFYHAKQKFLCPNYLRMFNRLYEDKNAQKKGTFAKEIYKNRCELIFGQPMKSYSYPGKAIFNKETKEFEIVDNDEKSFKQIQTEIAKRGIPMQVSLWVAAYSRLEEFTIINRIGLDKVVYGDTDSVKFIGDEGIKEIEKRNKEIDEEFRKVDKKYFIKFDTKLGRWLDEGDLACFKSIGIKWYITIDMNDKLVVKAAGANIENLTSQLEEKGDPIGNFNLKMKIWGLFKSIQLGKKKNSIALEYKNRIDNNLKKDILNHGTSLYYYNPYEKEEK